MKAGLFLCLALALPLFDGSNELSESLRSLESDLRALDRPAVLERAQDLLEGDDPLEGRLRADVHFARGLLLALVPAALEDGTADPDGTRKARPDFQAARAAAGPGQVRLDATYNIGWVDLIAAEAWFAQIPEVMEAAGTQAPPPAAAPAQASADDAAQAPDPLKNARARYVEARKGFIARLRSDWHDEDTRANLEWIQRRLHELNEIEESRQKEKDQQEDQEQDPEQSDDSQEGDSDQEQDSEQEPENEEGEESQDEKEQESKDGEQEEQPEQQSEDGQPEDQEQSEDQSQDESEQEQEADQAELPEGEPEPSDEAADQQPPERILTREEAMRLLDRLEEIEAEGERVRANLRRSRRVPVERDW